MSPAGHWVAASGADAVNATERLICGDAVARLPSIAEGLALAGRRSATLLAAGSSTSRTTELSAEIPWVHHRARPIESFPSGKIAFELVAATPQQAVDHCLVAHRIAEHLGRPGVCTLDRELAEGLSVMRLPDGPTVRRALATQAPAAASEVADPDVVVEAADRAFEAVSEQTGRECQAVTRHRVEDARYVLVGSGAAGDRAVAIADALRGRGVSCGAIVLALVQPLPRKTLARALADKEKICVLGSHGALPDLTSMVDDAARLVTLDIDSRTDMLDRVRTRLGLEPEGGPPEPREESPAPRRFVVGAAPAGSWSESFLLDTAALLGSRGELSLHRPRRPAAWASSLVIGNGPEPDLSAEPIDLLLVTHPSLLEPGLLETVRSGGMIVLVTREDPAATVPATLTRAGIGLLVDREIDIQWIDASALQDHSRHERAFLQGALLAALPELPRLVARVDDPLSAIAAECGCDPQAAGLRLGGEALRQLDLGDLEDFFRKPEQPVATIPRLAPTPGNGEPSTDWRRVFREFHMAGRKTPVSEQPLPPLPLRPAALKDLARSNPLSGHYPIVLGERMTSLSEIVRDALAELEALGQTAPILSEHHSRLTSLAARLLERRDGSVPVRELLDEVLQRLPEEFDLSQAANEALSDEIRSLAARLPETGAALGLGPHTLLALYRHAVLRDRRSRRDEFLQKVGKLIRSLQELLVIDDGYGPRGSSPAALSATFDDSSGAPVDPDALARNLPPRRGSTRLTRERRDRIEAALACLESYHAGTATAHELVLVHGGQSALPVASSDVRLIEHYEGMRIAIGLFDGLAADLVEVLRAVRVARLEVENRFDPKSHGPVLARLDWRSLAVEELLLLPAVVVLETAERLRGHSLAAFSSLLQSGRPVHVLVQESGSRVDAEGESWETLSGCRPDLGYLAVAHREAFVLQSTLARQGQLIDGLCKMTTVARPAVTLVAVPSFQAPVSPWLQLVAAHAARATPTFLYDCDAGTTWADRFDLSDNPDVDRPWPAGAFSYVDEAQTSQTLDEAFTFAHAAALDPGYREHFKIVPREAWDDDQLEIARYLELSGDERRGKLPFIWVVESDGTLGRAAMTREMAFASRDRKRAWRILQELAGTDNEYARRAAEAARAEALAEAATERDELEASYKGQVEQVRTGATGEVMERLVNALLGLDGTESPQLPLSVLESVEGVAAPAVRPTAPAAEEEEVAEQESGIEEPYIDSILCTTCNECTDLNPRMFKYNENKQAVITDPGQGTFRELVISAEKCPARCIHPGRPRSDDQTATEAMIARAAPFN